MNYFLNFSVNTGISYSTSRNPNAISCGDDFSDWVNDVEKKQYDSVVSADNLSDCVDLLEHGSYWNGGDVSQETLEMIHAFIKNIEGN